MTRLECCTGQVFVCPNLVCQQPALSCLWKAQGALYLADCWRNWLLLASIGKREVDDSWSLLLVPSLPICVLNWIHLDCECVQNWLWPTTPNRFLQPQLQIVTWTKMKRRRQRIWGGGVITDCARHATTGQQTRMSSVGCNNQVQRWDKLNKRCCGDLG